MLGPIICVCWCVGVLVCVCVYVAVAEVVCELVMRQCSVAMEMAEQMPKSLSLSQTLLTSVLPSLSATGPETSCHLLTAQGSH